MKTGFKNKLGDVKTNTVKSPWDFSAPSYDERSSCFINAGTHYGVGHRQPVGHQGNPSSSVIPRSSIPTLRVDETG